VDGWVGGWLDGARSGREPDDEVRIEPDLETSSLCLACSRWSIIMGAWKRMFIDRIQENTPIAIIDR